MSEIIDDTSGSAADPFPFPGREAEALKYRQTEAERAATRDPAPVKNRNNGEEQSLKNPDTGELSYVANATKGMPHDELGEVVPAFGQQQDAYEVLLDAIKSEDPAVFAAIPTGPNPALSGPDDPVQPTTRPFVDPQAGLALDLEGPDPPTLSAYRGVNREGKLNKQRILLVPRFTTSEIAADIGEIYLMALARDAHVTALQGDGPSADSRVNDAVRLLNNFSGYRGPLDPATETVTPQSLFRGGNVLAENGPSSKNEGELVGPYLSQFLIIGSRLDGEFPPAISPETGDKREGGLAATGATLRRTDGQVLYGTVTIDQKQFEVVPGLDFVTDYDTWLQILQGVRPDDPTLKRPERSQYTGQRRFVYSLRQASEYVHRDQTYQEGLIAALLILSMNERAERTGQSLFNPGNAYMGVPNQTGFATFGNGHVLALLAEANTRAIKAAWSGKWVNHRWLRPEVLGGRIHNTVVERVKRERYNIFKEISSLTTPPGDEILKMIAAHNLKQNEENGRDQIGDSYLLPQAYPEGSPTHPTYPAGHATQIAAEVTVMKGHFDGKFTITDDQDPALVPNADGTGLVGYSGPGGRDIKLTLEGELNKLAANVALARSVAGVHFRLDYSESVLLGEYVGLGILQEQARSYNQARRGANPEKAFFFELTLFFGVTVQVLADGQIVPV